jgi:hypothetical protein
MILNRLKKLDSAKVVNFKRLLNLFQINRRHKAEYAESFGVVFKLFSCNLTFIKILNVILSLFYELYFMR